MTLTITIMTAKRVYQSADFRLVDVATGKHSDFGTQKIAAFAKDNFVATVCFAGIGRAANVNVGDWLAELIAQFPNDGSFDEFLEALRTADAFLSTMRGVGLGRRVSRAAKPSNNRTRAAGNRGTCPRDPEARGGRGARRRSVPSHALAFAFGRDPFARRSSATWLRESLPDQRDWRTFEPGRSALTLATACPST